MSHGPPGIFRVGDRGMGVGPVVLGRMRGVAALALYLAGVWFAVRFILPPVAPFLLAYLLLMLLEPVGPALARLGGRPGSPAPVALGLVALAVPALVVALAVGEAMSLARDLPGLAARVGSILEDLWETLRPLIAGLPPVVGRALDAAGMGGVGFLGETVAWTVDALETVLLDRLPAAGVFTAVTALAVILMALDRGSLTGRARSLAAGVVPAAAAAGYARAVGFCLMIIRVEIALELGTALVIWAGLAAMGVQYPLLLSLLTAALGLLPVAGPATLLVPWAIGELAVGLPARGAWLLVMAAGVTAMRILIQSRTILRGAGLTPLEGLCAVYVGWRTLGPVGLVVGPLAILVWRGRHLD